MQESDRSMLMEFWLYQLLQEGNRPLCYARSRDERDDALVAFLLPLVPHHIKDVNCQVTLDPGPPCQVTFDFNHDGQIHAVLVPIDSSSGCQPEVLLVAAGQVDRFWLFISQEQNQNITLYEVEWHPIED